MANLGTIGVRTTAVLDGEVLNVHLLSGAKLPADDPSPLTYIDFPNQSKPALETFPGSRLFLGF